MEFTDYECPFCRRHFRETYEGLLAEFGDGLRYVVRNFPLTAIHPQARKAAEAAECAFAQGKFWEYHDLLFSRSPKLDPESLEGYAAKTGLDVASFRACLGSGRQAEVVAKDLQDGMSYGVTATPTFFINGRMVVGALSLAELKSYVNAALEEAQRTSGS